MPRDPARPSVPTDRFVITLPSRADYLGALRSVVRGFLEECMDARFSEEEMNGIQMALQEACINVVRHAHGRDATLPLVVTVSAPKGRFVLEVEDFGRGLPPRDQEPPDPDPQNPREGGYGIFIMRQVMDEVRSEFRDGKHVLILAKNLPAKEP